MRKVKFENRYGQFQAVINGTKKQFRQIEKNLVNYLDTHYPRAKVVSIEPVMAGDGTFRVMLDVGISFDYTPKYKIGEELEVIGGENVRIRIIGIEIQRLCNADAKEVLNEGFFREKVDGYMQFCYRDKENDNQLCHYFTHPQCLISFLYKTMRQETVLENPYSVVYKFEKVNG